MAVSAQNMESVGALEHGPEVTVSSVSLSGIYNSHFICIFHPKEII